MFFYYQTETVSTFLSTYETIECKAKIKSEKEISFVIMAKRDFCRFKFSEILLPTN